MAFGVESKVSSFYQNWELLAKRKEQPALDLLIDAMLDVDPKGHGFGIITAPAALYPCAGERPLHFNNTDRYRDIPYSFRNKAELAAKLSETVEIDGFVLAEELARRGVLTHSGLYFDGSTYQPLIEMRIPNDRPLWQRYGFSNEVGTGHLSAIAASYHYNTIAMRLSGEQRSLRVFYKGRIIGSMYAVEIAPERSIDQMPLLIISSIPQPLADQVVA